MISSIPIGAKVICTDDSFGKSTALIVDPGSRNVTHIAVVQESILHDEERLVSIDRVKKTTRDSIYLDCTTDDVLKMDPFTRTHYMEMDYGSEGYAYTAPYMTMYTDMTMAPQLSYLTIQDQLIPSGEVALHPGMIVETPEGPVGEVGELLLDPESHKITHFLLIKGHGKGKTESAIDVSAVSRGEEDTIYLKMNKEQVDKLPALPVNRAFNEVYATELEVMVWIFKGEKLAQDSLRQVKSFCKENKIELLNTTVLEKGINGETRARVDKMSPSKRSTALGVALGGLAGMVVGPVALAAGAVAGGMAGKKSAKKVEVALSEDKVQKLNDTLQPGGSALLLLIEHRWFSALQLELAEFGGQLIHERLSNITYEGMLEKINALENEG